VQAICQPYKTSKNINKGKQYVEQCVFYSVCKKNNVCAATMNACAMKHASNERNKHMQHNFCNTSSSICVTASCKTKPLHSTYKTDDNEPCSVRKMQMRNLAGAQPPRIRPCVSVGSKHDCEVMRATKISKNINKRKQY